ncbi:GNAT family N-acetyltransferase [Oceanicella actignis]|uniref:GNAT family N-acetyltransferase n=1 Tax=Oceanicella actignis TaxID=1189325 RepID=UPI0011E7D660|nr:GNAT family N-acetyltransferase [Oceanicella actignis]TYO89195.1 ribosomal-protein-alanine N-acetyltransferase [Oceanicella actignis]
MPPAPPAEQSAAHAAERAAAIHAAAFPHEPWSARAIADLAAAPGGFLLLDAAQDGFALGRVAADEAELLMLAVAPGARRRGAGRGLLAAFEARAAAMGARTAHLEVAADNAPALGLYRSAGYARAGLRPRYYSRPDGARIDAVLMTRKLRQGENGREDATFSPSAN